MYLRADDTKCFVYNAKVTAARGNNEKMMFRLFVLLRTCSDEREYSTELLFRIQWETIYTPFY